MTERIFKKVAEIFKKTPSSSWIIFFIVLIGIFLRTYNFHDWLRFSMDQSRDAMIISNALEGKSELPLLGPLAGGTDFHLGPAYYYFSFLSATLFGNYPDKMAYPSLIFSILSMPLLYLFMKEYFSGKISLILTAIMSVSYFAVINSRFSSNPNLTPFFVLLFLYSFSKLISGQNKNSIWWSVLVGLSLGIGIQLHATLLIIMPVCAVIFFAYFLKRSSLPALKHILVALLIFMTVNVTQIISEMRTNRKNTRQFFSGLTEKSGGKNSMINNISNILSCQFKANASIISSTQEIENCSKGIDFNIKTGSKELYDDIKNRILRRTTYSLNISFVLIFSLVGYFLAIYYFRKDKDAKKRIFLGMFLVFNSVSLLVMLPIANYLYVGYFIILLFVPFVFLGLWLKFLEEKFQIKGKRIGLCLVTVLVILSVWSDVKAAYLNDQGLDNSSENTDFREIKNVSDFILKNSLSEKIIYLSGENKYLDRYSRPVEYMISRQNKKLVIIDASQLGDGNIPSKFVFFIKNRGTSDIINNRPVDGYETISSCRFYAVDISVLKNNAK